MADPERTLPPPARPSPPRYRVWRSRNRVVAGVAGGLATALGVAPVWTRMGFVVLTLFDGVGVAGYLAGYLLLPAGPAAPAPRLVRRIVGLAIVPLWLLVAVSDGDWTVPDGPIGLALLLLGVAVALWSPRAADEGVASPMADVAMADLPPPAAPRPPTPPSPLGRGTLGLALLVAAVGTLIAQGSAEGIKISFGLAALVCGLGLLVGTFAGRARWLVVPAALLAGVSVAGAAIEDLDVSLRGSRQSTTYVTAGADTPPPPADVDVAGGDIHLQLEDVQDPVDGRIRVGYGSVQISAASDVRLEVRVQVGLGSIDMPNGSEDGYRRVATYADGPSDAPLVRYDIAVGFGGIEVDRFRPGAPPLDGRAPSPTRVRSSQTAMEGCCSRTAPISWPTARSTYPTARWCRRAWQRILGPQASMLPNGEVILPDGTQHRSGRHRHPVVRHRHPARATGIDRSGPDVRAGRPSGSRGLVRAHERPGGDSPPDSDLGRGGPTVKRHPLDPVSLVLGLLMVVVAIAALVRHASASCSTSPPQFVPIAAGLAGLALIASVLRRPASVPGRRG